ncbi:hypothetical protein B0A55_13064 [Friedmanniomyces simplex]|uniref:Uncharacterized protein n=1 Tax=Friedmanniomyces simplex TaxID=329884 RepID=A0A4U0WEZ0_9PEZI|nr:hypothetical protein B0A55_13064 [Friedmanniomyces simplex]
MLRGGRNTRRQINVNANTNATEQRNAGVRRNLGSVNVELCGGSNNRRSRITTRENPLQRPATDTQLAQAPPPATQLSHDELMSLIEALTNTPGDARKQEANANGLATALGQVIRAVAGGLERKNGGQANDGGGRTDVKPRGGPWPWW